ncbi:hypothetical protein F5Y19DRAFT_487906 [Xylariaceae sp. FL1651]|nr:hypothetical protein F5Y19DRAFT_487906 [Xylariaceae sp. FL1651]
MSKTDFHLARIHLLFYHPQTKISRKTVLSSEQDGQLFWNYGTPESLDGIMLLSRARERDIVDNTTPESMAVADKGLEQLSEATFRDAEIWAEATRTLTRIREAEIGQLKNELETERALRQQEDTDSAAIERRIVDLFAQRKEKEKNEACQNEEARKALEAEIRRLGQSIQHLKKRLASLRRTLVNRRWSEKRSRWRLARSKSWNQR